VLYYWASRSVDTLKRLVRKLDGPIGARGGVLDGVAADEPAASRGLMDSGPPTGRGPWSCADQSSSTSEELIDLS
jgi:hypothetical protein